MKANLRRFLTVMAVAVAGVLSVGAETVTPGAWCTDLNAAKSYAVKNKMPLFCFYGVNGCSYCSKGFTAINSSTFKNWMAKRRIVLLQLHPASWSYDDAWVFASNDYQADEFPACRVWWPKNGSKTSGVVGRAFVGRLNNSYLKTFSGTKLEDKLISAIESFIGPWTTPAVAPAAAAPAATKTATKASNAVAVPAEWAKSRTLRGVVVEGRAVVGLCEVKCGKASKKGEAKVSAKLTFFDKRTRISLKSQKAAVGNSVSLAWTTTAGNFALTVSKGAFSGGSGSQTVASANLGGEVAGAHVLELEDWSDGGPLPFSAEKKKWMFAATAGTKKSKLSYNPKTGVFKGSLKLLHDPSRDEDDPKWKKTVSLKVNGLVVEGGLVGVGVRKDFKTDVRGE